MITIVNTISVKFKHIGSNGMKIIFELLNNQNFLRYIKYLEVDDPLDKNLPDIPSNGIINDGANKGCIFPMPFNDSFLTDTSAILFFNPYEFDNLRHTVSTDVYSMDIIIPNRYWYIYTLGAWRPYLIIYEIVQSLDRKKVAGLGDVQIVGVSKPYKVANEYSGVTVFIQVSNATVTK